MHFAKPLTMLAGAGMMALVLAAPVADDPADEISIAETHETPQAFAKAVAKHTTKPAKVHTTKTSKPRTTKPLKPHTTKTTKVPTATTPKQRPTKPAKSPVTKTPKPNQPKTSVRPAKPSTTKPVKPTKTSTKPAKPPATKPVKSSITKPAKSSTTKPVKSSTTSKPVKSSTTKPAMPSAKKSTVSKPTKPPLTKSRKPTASKSVKTHTTKSAKLPVAKPSKLSASKSAKTHLTKSTKPPASTQKPSGKSAKPAPTIHPSNSTSAAPSKASTPASCPLPPKAPKKPSVHRRIYHAVARLFQRDETLFIGWHGTNDKTATFWETNGHIVKPPTKSSVFGGIFGKSGPDGSSGADAEFGPGLYVTDDVFTAGIYSDKNFKQNNLDAGKAGKPQDYKPKVCAIYAKSKSKWLDQTPKIVIPPSLKGNDQSKEDKAKGIPDPEWEKKRIAYIKEQMPAVDAATVQRFAKLTLSTDKKIDDGPGTAQLILVQGQDYEAHCFDPTPDKKTPPPGATNSGTYPDFAYMSLQLQKVWNIFREKCE